MFKVLSEKKNGFDVIEITDGIFKGFQIVYGKVKFAEEPNEDGTYTLYFDCDVVNDLVITDNDAFRQVAGDILTALIEISIKEANCLLKGGSEDTDVQQ